MLKILVIEDEKYMLNLINIHLGDEYLISEAKDGSVALELLTKQTFDLVLLDIMIPYIDGWEICRLIREKSDVPILMLTARTDLHDKVKGLELGADDYLTKPFEFDELKARIKALLRRANKTQTQKIHYHDCFQLNYKTRELYIKNQRVELTPKEFELLYFLASTPMRIYTRDILLDQVWEEGEYRDLRIVDTHIKNIRMKLKQVAKDTIFIKTVWGVGYSFNISEGNHEVK